MNPYLYGYRLIAALAALLLTTAAHAQPAQDFYKGKQLRLIVGSAVFPKSRRRPSRTAVSTSPASSVWPMSRATVAKTEMSRA